jgi:hypothetical protein
VTDLDLSAAVEAAEAAVAITGAVDPLDQAMAAVQAAGEALVRTGQVLRASKATLRST